MKLFDAPIAPNPRRVRIFLAEKGLEIDRVTLDLRRDEHRQPAYLAINPRGMVPALRLDDGTVIDDSHGICRYIEALHPDPPLLGENPAEIGLIESWVRRVESDGYQAVAYNLRNIDPRFAGRAIAGKWPDMPQIPALAARGKTMFTTFAQALDDHLAARTFIATDRYTAADITALVTLDFARATGLFWDEGFKNLDRWHERVSARPSATA